MADTVTSPRGAEISERSSEFVLPEDERVAAPLQREFGVSESEGTTTRIVGDRNEGARDGSAGRRAALADGLTSNGVTGARSNAAAPKTSATGLANSLTLPPGGPPPSGQATSAPSDSRGAPLPGDRGPRNQPAQSPRPSFWRRIALGRRNPIGASGGRNDSAAGDGIPANAAPPQPQASVPATPERRTLTERARNVVAPQPAVDTRSIERVIMEPMLQALVSVEAKLERSHSEIVGRSDAVEQRLTQLWDIEEQLGTLSELQESLLQVSEQQRRLESAVVSQTKTLRWLVGAVFFSLASAAFVVAAVLR